jgi:aspartate aminotransferase
MKRSNRAKTARFSTTLAIDDQARKLKAEGVKLWGFGAGQPDFPTPEAISAAGIQAIKDGKTVYTSPQGTVELRRAICAKLERDNGLKYAPDQVVVSAGAKQALYMALAVLVDPGDEVLVPAPFWVSYPEMIQLLDGVPVILPTDEATGFKVTPEQLAAAITPRTVAIILNTPSNPTGIVYERSELEALGRVLAERGLHLITDEIYERILYDGAVHVSPAAASPDLRERTAVVNGVSKAFSMTGWRIGYLAAPRAWADPAVAMQSHLSGNPCSISQEATVAALNGDDATVRVMVETFAKRRRRVLELLTEAPALRVLPPKGAFYVFPDVSAYYGRSLDGAGKAVSGSQGMAEYLLETARVVLVPGDAFGSDRHLRISFACAETVIEEGLRSMTTSLARLR